MAAMAPHRLERPGGHERPAQRCELRVIILPAGVHVSAGASQRAAGAVALAGDVKRELLQRLQHAANHWQRSFL